MNKWVLIVFFLILAIAMSLRIPHLADRPMHHDEANQAYRFGVLLENNVYTYDADDHHGPTLYYLTLPSAWVSGVKKFAQTSEVTYRAVPVLFGLLIIICTPLLRNGMGAVAVLGAALLTALSPAMAYYSRVYIQEMLFVFFTLTMLAAGWQSYFKGSRTWASVCGISAGLMFATKETSILTFAAVGGSVLICMAATRKIHLPIKNIIIGVCCAVIISYILYSSFFTNPQGPIDSILAFKGYVERGTGVDTDHVHPWYFYLKMLTYYRFDGGPVWSEALVFSLGIFGSICILSDKMPKGCDIGFARFLLFYTLLLTLVYSVIAYKTPWCILSFLHGWILLAGIGVAMVLELAQRGRMPRLHYGFVLAVLLVVAFGNSRLANKTVFRYAADYRNPYVYAHTSPDFMNLVQRIEDIREIAPGGREMYIQVIADPDETWPLPFYLRGYPQIGYWSDADLLPSKPRPQVVITSPDIEMDQGTYVSEYYGLRADTLLAVHIEKTLWASFIETRK